MKLQNDVACEFRDYIQVSLLLPQEYLFLELELSVTAEEKKNRTNYAV